MYLREPYVTKYIIEEKISEISFVGNVGGLLGLLMGFSFMSIVELIYLCCLNRGRIRSSGIEGQDKIESGAATAWGNKATFENHTMS